MINYLAYALSKPISERKPAMPTINITDTSRLLGEVADTLRKAVFAALEEEADYRRVFFDADTALGPNRVIRCFLGEPNGTWVADQYAYFARAIPEAFGYNTRYTVSGNILVTTAEGCCVCEFKLPEAVEDLA